MKIYVWYCDVCEMKGATNIKPMASDLIHIPCGEKLRIEVFSDVFYIYHELVDCFSAHSASFACAFVNRS